MAFTRVIDTFHELRGYRQAFMLLLAWPMGSYLRGTKGSKA